MKTTLRKMHALGKGHMHQSPGVVVTGGLVILCGAFLANLFDWSLVQFLVAYGVYRIGIGVLLSLLWDTGYWG